MGWWEVRSKPNSFYQNSVVTMMGKNIRTRNSTVRPHRSKGSREDSRKSDSTMGFLRCSIAFGSGT